MRIRPLTDPVTLHLDGDAVPAERGEPAAAALIAAEYLSFARSPKFHRPRGPACLRAGCDGCLARVDGVPNVMTCRVPAADGMRIETQNVVGSRDHDLLEAADWFFPEGMNHHELLAGVPGVSRVMQGLARRIAGLGELPSHDAPQPPARAASRRTADVLVVGAGLYGMAAAVELASRGRAVEIVDDDLSWGGSLRGLRGFPLDLGGGREANLASAWSSLVDAFTRTLRAGTSLRLRTTAAGIYDDDVLLSSPAGVEVVTPRTLILATGAHDGTLPFEGNDVPGVMSARAGCRLLAHGVVPGKRVVVLAPEGRGADAYATRLFAEAYVAARPDAKLVAGVPERARGSRRVREITVQTSDGKRGFTCDALLIDAARAPAYELPAQAGAQLSHGPAGFLPAVGPGGAIRNDRRVLALGEVAGDPVDPERARERARALLR
jgi:sarcosine oxidase, subunit alpha